MKQKQLKEALANIHERKREAEFQYDKLIAPLYENKEFLKLEKEHTKLVIENAKKEANNLSPDVNKEKELEKKLAEIKKQYNLENLQPNYSCKLCNDEGYINGNICKCLKQEFTKLLLKDSGFEKLENFDEAIKTCGNLSKHYEIMKKWCNSNSIKNLIYISGPTGVGKTYLIRCMANELIENGKIIKISTAFQMNQDFKEFSKTFNEDLLDRYLDCEVLFIDDLGTEPLYRNVTIEYLYLIINERKMKKLPTIITTNLNLSDLRDRYDERIFSRIVDRQTSITLSIDDEDKRLQCNNK